MSEARQVRQMCKTFWVRFVLNWRVHVLFIVGCSSSQLQLIGAIQGVGSALKTRNFYPKLQTTSLKKNKLKNLAILCSHFSMAEAELRLPEALGQSCRSSQKGTGSLSMWPGWLNLSNGAGQTVPRRGWCSEAQTLRSLMSFMEVIVRAEALSGVFWSLGILHFIMRNSASLLF